MKNMKLPDSDEWKKIVDDAFSSDEFHVFSENYNMKKHSMQSMRKGITMKKNNLIMNLTVAAATLTVVAVPTVIYLSSNTSQTQQYTQVSDEESSSEEVTVAESTQATAVVNDNETEVTITDGEDDGQVNEEIHQFTEDIDYETIYNLEYGWLPEGLEYNEDGPYALKFKNINNDRSGITPGFTKYPDGDKTPAIVNRCKNTEEYTIDGKTVTISYRDDYEENADNYNFGRIADVSFDGTPYSASLWVTDDITKADLAKIIENMHLVPSDTETAFIHSREEEEMLNEYNVTYTNVYSSIQKIYKIGEDINIEDDGFGHGISVKVNDISFDTTFGENNPDGALGITEELYNQINDAGYLDETGTLTDNIRRYIQYSNGSDIEYKETEENIPTNIITISMTYTNTGNTTIENVFNSDNNFFLITKRDTDFISMYDTKMLDHFGCCDNEQFGFRDTFDVLKADDFNEFIYYTQEKNSLAPNESTEVKIAFSVEVEFMDNLYLDLSFNALPTQPVNEASHLVNVSISEKPE